MTESIELTRRKALAALGGIGVTSAGAGFGTTAYFSDREEYATNTVTAGALDLKLDWEEHYWSDDGDDLDEWLVETDGDPSAVPDGYVGLPDPANPLVAVAGDHLEQFMNATSVEAYPDTDDDGVQDPFASAPGETTPAGVGYVCEDGADTAVDLDPTVDGALRTENGDTVTESGDPKPLIALDDVKPGDFGELTLSIHLCGNPGYIWFNGTLTSNAENGVTDPEARSPAESDPEGAASPDADGELLDAIRTRLWYDDGDNVVEVAGESPADGGYLTPVQTLRELLVLLEAGNGIRLCPGGAGDVVEPPGDSPSCPEESDYDSRHATGDTVTIDTPQTSGPVEFTIPGNPNCADFGLLRAVKTDEAPEGTLPENGTKTYLTPYGELTVSTALVDGRQTITDWSLDSDDGFCVAKVIVKGGRDGANVYSYDNDDGDDDFTDGGAAGSKSDTDTQLQTPTGQDISHVSLCLSTSTGDDGPPPDRSCCFQPSVDHYLGVAWWLPEDTGNEIQTDSVGLDLGFYTEQCRHNDGAVNRPQ